MTPVFESTFDVTRRQLALWDLPLNVKDPPWCREIFQTFSWLSSTKTNKRSHLADSTPSLSLRELWQVWKRRGICSGQNLTPTRITTRVQWQKHEKALRMFILKSQTYLNRTVFLTHNSEATLPSEDISRLGARSHTATWSWLDSDRMPRHVVTLSIITSRSR